MVIVITIINNNNQGTSSCSVEHSEMNGKGKPVSLQELNQPDKCQQVSLSLLKNTFPSRRLIKIKHIFKKINNKKKCQADYSVNLPFVFLRSFAKKYSPPRLRDCICTGRRRGQSQYTSPTTLHTN